MGEVYTPDCAADLGDARWGVDLTPFEESAAVGTVISATTFEASPVQATRWYDAGKLLDARLHRNVLEHGGQSFT